LVSPEGRQIKLSSKGAKGAMASSVNLLVALRELEQAGMPEFAQNYPQVIEILNTIDRGNHDSGPLNLAVQFGIITPDEISQVMSLKQSAGDPNFDIKKTNLSKNLKQLYQDRTAEDPSKVVPLNHLVASIAYNVCDEINIKPTSLRQQPIFSITRPLCKCIPMLTNPKMANLSSKVSEPFGPASCLLKSHWKHKRVIVQLPVLVANWFSTSTKSPRSFPMLKRPPLQMLPVVAKPVNSVITWAQESAPTNWISAVKPEAV
jgi:hypothetical protein